MQHPVYRDALGGTLEINPVIANAITKELFSVALDDAKPLRIGFVPILGEHLKVCQKIQLQRSGERSHFGSTYLVEDDLKHSLEEPPLFTDPAEEPPPHQPCCRTGNGDYIPQSFLASRKASTASLVFPVISQM